MLVSSVPAHTRTPCVAASLDRHDPRLDGIALQPRSKRKVSGFPDDVDSRTRPDVASPAPLSRRGVPKCENDHIVEPVKRRGERENAALLFEIMGLRDDDVIGRAVQ